ncbi:MAG: LWR-salt protein [Halobacteriaceae archaeon]
MTTPRYTFRVRFRLDPDGVTVDPAEFETRMARPAVDPGTDGWLFFRDNLWRGEIGDESHLASLATEALGVRVVDIEYAAFITDREHWAAFREAIAADLEAFRADDVESVITKYLGSSVELRD